MQVVVDEQVRQYFALSASDRDGNNDASQSIDRSLEYQT